MATKARTSKPAKKVAPKAKPAKTAVKAVKPAKAPSTPRVKKTQPAPVSTPVETGTVQHVPGQTEIPSVTPEVKAQHDEAQTQPIPAVGNNIASVHDRAHADMPPANLQPPVEKTFVSPKDP